MKIMGTCILLTCLLVISGFSVEASYRPRSMQRQLQQKVQQVMAQAYLPVFRQPAFDPSKCNPYAALGPSNQFMRCLISPSVRYMSVRVMALAQKINSTENPERSDRKEMLRLGCDFALKMMDCTSSMHSLMQNCMTNVNGNISLQLADVTNTYFCDTSESGERKSVKFFDLGVDDCIIAQKPSIDSCIDETGLRYVQTETKEEYCRHLGIFKKCVKTGMKQCDSQTPQEVIMQWYQNIQTRLDCEQETETVQEESEQEDSSENMMQVMQQIKIQQRSVKTDGRKVYLKCFFGKNSCF